MAVTHIATVRNTLADTVVDLLDVGAGANGTLEFLLADATTEVATCNFTAKATNAFGAAAGGTATANAIADDTNATGNASPVAVFKAKDCNGSEVFRGSVATSGGDINLSSLTIANGDTVSMSSLTYSSAA